MAAVPGRTLRCPTKVDTGFAIGSMLRLQVPRVRMANGLAFGKFGVRPGYKVGQSFSELPGSDESRY